MSITKAILPRTFLRGATALEKLALACGVLPMALGTLDLALYSITRKHEFEEWGLFIIFLGLALFAVGVAALCMQWFRWKRAAGGRPGGSGMRVAAAAALLLLNFPLAGFYAFEGERLMSTYEITLVNEAAVPLEAVVVTGPDDYRKEVASIAPGGRVRFAFVCHEDGSVKLTARLDGKPIQYTIIGYVTKDAGQRVEVRIGPDGQIIP